MVEKKAKITEGGPEDTNCRKNEVKACCLKKRGSV
jgi:hypothetical protein